MSDRIPPTDEERQARSRHFILSALRFTGAALTLFGCLIYAGKVDFVSGDGSNFVGIALILAGLVDFFWIPLALKNFWRNKD